MDTNTDTISSGGKYVTATVVLSSVAVSLIWVLPLFIIILRSNDETDTTGKTEAIAAAEERLAEQFEQVTQSATRLLANTDSLLLDNEAGTTLLSSSSRSERLSEYLAEAGYHPLTPDQLAAAEETYRQAVAGYRQAAAHLAGLLADDPLDIIDTKIELLDPLLSMRELASAIEGSSLRLTAGGKIKEPGCGSTYYGDFTGWLTGLTDSRQQ